MEGVVAPLPLCLPRPAVCFILAAWFALGPDWRDAGLVPYMFLACGLVMAGLALTGNALWRGRPHDRGGPA